MGGQVLVDLTEATLIICGCEGAGTLAFFLDPDEPSPDLLRFFSLPAPMAAIRDKEWGKDEEFDLSALARQQLLQTRILFQDRLLERLQLFFFCREGPPENLPGTGR
jgi:hypothetical protein